MSPTTRYFRPLVVLIGAALGSLLLWGLLQASTSTPAHAAGSCTTTAGTTTCTFASTGLEDTFMVPPGVSSVHVVAIGAPGAVGFDGSTAGRGARVSGDLTGLVADQTLYVEVGGAPTNVAGTCYPDVACIGGFNGGGTSKFGGGGGGGASDVRTKPRTVPLASDDSRLIVAGGGGGSGEAGNCGDRFEPVAGAGGDAGSDGGDGGPCPSIAGGTGGEAGTQSAGGAGGISEGQDGSLGQGGGGGFYGGGGGGGGYYGGGGGGELGFDDNGFDVSAAGGGGGGSNLVPSGDTPSITSDSPSITISYTDQADTTPPRVTNTSLTATTPQGDASKTTNVTAEFSEEVQNVTTETFILERRIAVKKGAPPKFERVAATVTLKPNEVHNESIPDDAVLDPVQDLPKGDYRATITTDVTDLADPANALDQNPDQEGKQPKVWTFKVAK